MEIIKLVSYCISHVSMMGYILLFTKRRYSLKKTTGILAGTAVILIALELLEKGSFMMMPRDSLLRMGAYLMQIVLVQVVTIQISEYRDGRALFTGFSASNYVLSGVLIGMYAYRIVGHGAEILFFTILIHATTLGVFYVSLRPAYMELQAAMPEGWFGICLLPALFTSRHTVWIWSFSAAGGSLQPFLPWCFS